MTGCETIPNPPGHQPSVTLPVILTQDCGKAEVKGTTWKDLVLAYQDAKEKLELCNSRMKEIRKHTSE